MFKRRTKRSYLQTIGDAFYPKGGWTRAALYVKHRVRRLPDSPRRIARGIFAGVFTSFTPLFGLHFVIAALMSKVIRGNIFASLMATFVGNPLTFPFIGYMSMKLGHLILGTRFDEATHRTLVGKFMGAGNDLKHNFLALFNDDTAHWGNLYRFYYEVFLPYLVGGIVPGIIAGLVAYYLSEPLIGAYQKRRRKKLRERFEKLRAKMNALAEEQQGKG